MKKSGLGALVALAMTLPIASAQAESVRPGIVSMPSVQAGAVKLPSSIRAGKRVSKQGSDLLGAPLFLIFLGAVAVTIGTIVIVNNNGSSSPG